jgi:hypothetical protein
MYSYLLGNGLTKDLLPTPITENYVPVSTPADGDCFYNAVALSLFGNAKYRNLIRLSVLHEVLHNEEKWETFLSVSMSEISFEDFVLDNVRSGSWAISEVIFVAAKVSLD